MARPLDLRSRAQGRGGDRHEGLAPFLGTRASREQNIIHCSYLCHQSVPTFISPTPRWHRMDTDSSGRVRVIRLSMADLLSDCTAPATIESSSVDGVPVLRQPADGAAPEARGDGRGPAPRAPADAADALIGAVSSRAGHFLLLPLDVAVRRKLRSSAGDRSRIHRSRERAAERVVEPPSRARPRSRWTRPGCAGKSVVWYRRCSPGSPPVQSPTSLLPVKSSTKRRRFGSSAEFVGRS